MVSYNHFLYINKTLNLDYEKVITCFVDNYGAEIKNWGEGNIVTLTVSSSDNKKNPSFKKIWDLYWFFYTVEPE